MNEESLLVCGGCNAKLGPDLLSLVLKDLPVKTRDDILIGYDTADDGAIIAINDDVAIIQTMDFFPAIVEDPYSFGQIAAANALSDCYAMGGEPIAAMNMVCYPEEGDIDALKAILKGGADKVMEAGATLIGGHSIHDPRPKYGLSVLGRVHPKKIWRNNTPKDKDILVLTKALGTGLISSGVNGGILSQDALAVAIQSMSTLNNKAASILKGFSVHAATDITGFGLSGHLLEMLGNSFNAVLYAESLPLLPYAKEAAENYCFTAGGQRNRNHAQPFMESELPFYLQEVLFDPQTSGGLLAAVPMEELEALLAAFAEEDLLLAVIGHIEQGTKKIIISK